MNKAKKPTDLPWPDGQAHVFHQGLTYEDFLKNNPVQLEWLTRLNDKEGMGYQVFQSQWGKRALKRFALKEGTSENCERLSEAGVDWDGDDYLVKFDMARPSGLWAGFDWDRAGYEKIDLVGHKVFDWLIKKGVPPSAEALRKMVDAKNLGVEKFEKALGLVEKVEPELVSKVCTKMNVEYLTLLVIKGALKTKGFATQWCEACVEPMRGEQWHYKVSRSDMDDVLSRVLEQVLANDELPLMRKIKSTDTGSGWSWVNGSQANLGGMVETLKVLNCTKSIRVLVNAWMNDDKKQRLVAKLLTGTYGVGDLRQKWLITTSLKEHSEIQQVSVEQTGDQLQKKKTVPRL